MALLGQTLTKLSRPGRILKFAKTPTFPKIRNPGVGSSINALAPQAPHCPDIRLERLDLRPIDLGPSSKAFILHDVFSPGECEKLIQLTEAMGYEEAGVQVGGGKEVLAKSLRNNSRIVVFDEPFAEALFQRIHLKLPQFLWGGALAGLNERIKFLRYFPGECFKAHYDGVYVRPDGTERSLLTLQMYLNDDFQGGGTVFQNPVTRQTMSVTPKTGMILGFTKDLFHEGAVLTRGTKYTIRTGVMYYNPLLFPFRIDLE